VTPPVRLGAVAYLNVRPLVWDLDPRVFTLRFDVPSVCARLLDAGEIDLGMVPSITYLDRQDDRIVPGIAIASEGAVASVAIFTRRPIREVRTLALDTSSRTSVALTRILCARHFEVSPTFVPHGPDLPAMLAAADAALLIGDPALFADHRALGAEKIDLGETWTAMTGKPFVWAFWSGRSDAASPEIVAELQATRDRGITRTDEIADRYCAGDAEAQAVARAYLRDHIKFDLTDRALDGLRTYYAEAAALDLAPAGEPRFFTRRTDAGGGRGALPGAG
jgi:chorismate dehydratase